MYTLVDLHWIKKDSDGLLFTKKSKELYQEYVDYHNTNGSGNISVANTDIYEALVGVYNGKSVSFCKIKPAGRVLRSEYLQLSKKRKRGKLIKELCQSVLLYITGKNDVSGVSSEDIDAMIAANASLLGHLTNNRHSSAKTLIDSITPDSFITQLDLDNVQRMYDTYTEKINETV
jgi:hypothetical protein